MSQPKSAKNLRTDWENDLPPMRFRIRVKDAIKAAGNASRLAKELGITRAAVYQWMPPYRHDPYIPIKAAVSFMEKRKLRAKLREVLKAE